MKKKIILVLFLAIQVSCIFSAPVSDEQVTLLAKQKREFIRGVRGIRHIFSKDTITPEERAALKSLVKKGAVLTAALAGIAVAGYVGKKLGKKYLGKENSGGNKLFKEVSAELKIAVDELFADTGYSKRSRKPSCGKKHSGPVPEDSMLLCGCLVPIELPYFDTSEKSWEKYDKTCFTSVTIGKGTQQNERPVFEVTIKSIADETADDVNTIYDKIQALIFEQDSNALIKRNLYRLNQNGLNPLETIDEVYKGF